MFGLWLRYSRPKSGVVGVCVKMQAGEWGAIEKR